MNFITKKYLLQCFLSLISNWYTQLELHFLSVWVVTLAVLPSYVLSNLQTFYTDGMGFSTPVAAIYVNAQNASTVLFGIVGVAVLDGYLTHYGMIFISSLFYSAGLFLLTGACYHLNSSEYKDIAVSWLVGTGLTLITCGKYSLTHSAITLSGELAVTPLDFIKYIATIVIIIIDIVDYEAFGSSTTSPKKFLVPALLMCMVTLVSFSYIKSKFFIKAREDRRNPLKYVPRVYMAALLKCHLPSPQDPNNLYEGNPEHPLEYTNRKRFLGKAAIKETSEPENERKKWLCTVTEVEETKHLLHMVPICMAFLPYGLVKSIGDTFFLEQADQKDSTIGSEDDYTKIPVQAFLLLANLSSLASTKLYKVFIYKRLVGSGNRYAPAIEFAMGMVLSTLSCAVASWIAMETYTGSSKMSVFWLAPQFIIFGAMEGLAGKGIGEFFSGELPSSMKNYDTVFAEGIVGAGIFCAIILVSVTKAATTWFSEENTRLDRFYHLCTVIGIIIFFGYSYAAVRYYCQEDQRIQVEDVTLQDEGDIEAAEHLIEMTQASKEEIEEVPEADSIQSNQLEEDLREEQNGEQQLLRGQFNDSEMAST